MSEIRINPKLPIRKEVTRPPKKPVRKPKEKVLVAVRFHKKTHLFEFGSLAKAKSFIKESSLNCPELAFAISRVRGDK